MMRFIAIAAAAMLLAGSSIPSRADSMTFTVGEARTLLAGLLALDCLDHVEVKGGRIECREGTRFKFNGVTTMTIAGNIDALMAVSRRFEAERQKVIDVAPKGDTAAVETKILEMLAAPQKIDLTRIAVSDLQLDDGAKNPIPAATLSAIYPLIKH